MKKFLSLLRIETTCIHISGYRIFLSKKMKNSNIDNFNHHGSFVSVKVSTPCQGSHTLFLCESRFSHLAKVPKPYFYVIQGFHTLFLCELRFLHLAKVSTPCFYVSQGSHTLPRFPHFVSYESRFPHLAKVSTPRFYVSQGFHNLFLCESRFPHLAKVPTPCFYVSQGSHTLPRFPHLVSM